MPLPKPLPQEGGAYILNIKWFTPFSLGRRGQGEEEKKERWVSLSFLRN
jgi:hypothetical protein